MTNEYTRSTGSHFLNWAMIAGAALLFLEVTVSSLQPVPTHAATVQTVTVPSDRVAKN